MLRNTALSILAMALGALADDHTASSVSTLDFKNQFVSSGIVPEVIAALDPSVSFYASYKAGEDGHDELLVPGSSLNISEATMPFEFSVENLNNATNITAQTRFLIYLVCAPVSFALPHVLTRHLSSSMQMLRHAVTQPQGTSAIILQATTLGWGATQLFCPLLSSLLCRTDSSAPLRHSRAQTRHQTQACTASSTRFTPNQHDSTQQDSSRWEWKLKLRTGM
jgi:hypothetical protein